jgi:hypothetical protein
MLTQRGIKALVIACNTATAAAVQHVRAQYPDLIVIGIEPALKLAADHYPGGRIGVMATEVTLREEKFDTLLHRFDENCTVAKIPAPGLVQLIEAGLVLRFPSGICVIRHWKLNNLIKKDRYKPTNCVAEKQLLLQDETGAFTLEPVRNPIGTHPEPQDRLGKDREGQEREEPAADAAAHARRGVKRTARGPYGWIRLSDEEYHSLLDDFGEAEVARCIAYVEESAQTTGNKNQWQDWNLVLRRCHRDRWGLSKAAAKVQTVTEADGYDDEDSFI